VAGKVHKVYAQQVQPNTGLAMSVMHELGPDGIMVLTLNRPEKLNALDTASKERLGELWQTAAQNPEIRVVLIRGAGEKAFCAGSDIKEIQRTGRMVSTETLMRAIPGVGTELNKPTIAALHGFTIGMGLTLAIHCDFRIAAPDTRLGFPEVQHGMISGISAITLPGLVGEAAALDLMLSGRVIDADEAQRCGLVNSIAADPYGEALALAKSLAMNSLRATELTKNLILSDRRDRIRQFGAEVDRARIGVTESTEYRDVVSQSPGAGRARI
jgi:enoyl-CoA hydratase/carnithine racemase